MSLRFRRRLRIVAARSLRALQRHYVTAVSACILGGAAYVASTSGGFQDPQEAGRANSSESTAPLMAQAAPTPSPVSIRLTPRPRRKAIVYVVSSEIEGIEVLAMHNRLVWDTLAGDTPNLPDIRYLVAGTPEEQSLAIQTLNNYLEIGPLLRIDFEIVDLRPGRGVAANTETP